MRDYVDQTWGWNDIQQRQMFDERFNPNALEIIELDHRPIGYIAVERKPEEIFLAAIEIAPEFQNRGVGTKLILDLLRKAEDLRRPLRLSVLKVNRAQNLYRRLGFECSEETKTHYIMRRLPVVTPPELPPRTTPIDHE
jgi:ribosomal protein S18 acetylase RimI-like enzyme